MNILTHPARALGSAAIAAALVGGGLGLAAAPAQAATAFSSLTLQHSAAVDVGGACASSAPTLDVPADVNPGENTQFVSHASVQRSTHANGDLNDIIGGSATVTGTVRTTTRQGLPKSVQLDFSGTVKTMSKYPTSSCSLTPRADLKFRFTFTTDRPVWATLSYSKTGSTYAEAYLWDEVNEPYEDLYGKLWKGSGSTTVLLPAGSYGGYVEGNPYAPKINTTKTLTSSGKVRIAFAPVGSAIATPKGAAQGYAALGSARSCTTHALPAKLTASSSRIKKIAKVSFSVNGTTVKTLKGSSIKRGLSVKLPIKDSAKASVTTTVRLKSGTTLTARGSYRACA